MVGYEPFLPRTHSVVCEVPELCDNVSFKEFHCRAADDDGTVLFNGGYFGVGFVEGHYPA